jgi:hypothetical protein
MDGPFDATMRLALDEARRALHHGDVPVGALVVAADGTVVAADHNRWHCAPRQPRSPIGVSPDTRWW